MEEKTQALVEKNIRLVYYVFGKMAHCNLFFRNKDDLISEGFIGLIKAAEKFDISRDVKFVSFAVKCIKNQILMGLRKLRKLSDHEISLDAPISMDENGQEIYWHDVLKAPQSMKMEERLDLQTFLATASEKERHIIRAKYIGYTQKEIGEQLHLSQSYVARLYKRLCTRFQVRENVG